MDLRGLIVIGIGILAIIFRKEWAANNIKFNEQHFKGKFFRSSPKKIQIVSLIWGIIAIFFGMMILFKLHP
ncbi:hypothetical protein [Hydrogenispora ethanolica]|uniref:hypothetical protein n=1 Tax=Hydrogenispora ethanolica TaxID=1082276 RepID=UPI00105324CC|nr:hypothetical protein [Hydrogenispora ethanolica]